MASFEELLQKNRQKIDKLKEHDSETVSGRKKIVRSGPTRPWQDNLPQYQSDDLDKTEISTAELNTTPIFERLSHIQTKDEPNVSQNRANHEPNISQDKSSPSSEFSVSVDRINSSGSSKAAVPVKLSGSPISKNGPQDEIAHGNTRFVEDLGQSEAKHEPIISQKRLIPEPYISQSGAVHAPVNRTQEVNHEPKPKPNPKPTISQTRFIHEPIEQFHALVGLQRKLLVYIYDSCRLNGQKTSLPIGAHELVLEAKSTKSAVRKAIQRLLEKGFIIRVRYKDGRGGWTQYGVPDVTYNVLLLNETRAKVEPNISQTRAKVEPQPKPQHEPTVPIVVVPNSLGLKTTNIEASIIESPCFIIPNELTGAVSRRQLNQFVLEGKISETELQMSLDAFAFDLRNKLISMKHTANPIGLLIGAIKNNGGYNSQKFAEVLKTEMKLALGSQQQLEDSISDFKSTKAWSVYQEMKTSSPEAFQALISKYEKQGLKGELLEEFGFLEFQAQQGVLLSGNNPLRPAGE